MQLNPIYIDNLIKTALQEDMPYIDMATDFLFDNHNDFTAKAVFLSKADGVLSGIDAALRVFSVLDPSADFTKHFYDGDIISKGDIIAEVIAPCSVLLKAERTSLNLVRLMSGIATYTKTCVDLIAEVNNNCIVADTRKTLPGLRALQKYAVLCGGGKNHRFSLSDAAMIKNNHVDVCGGIPQAVQKLRERIGHMTMFEVEVRDFFELEQALSANAPVIMLDNMPLTDMRKAVEITGHRAVLEASGNITPENIKSVAETGVDVISLGALTHTIAEFDISLRIRNQR